MTGRNKVTKATRVDSLSVTMKKVSGAWGEFVVLPLFVGFFVSLSFTFYIHC